MFVTVCHFRPWSNICGKALEPTSRIESRKELRLTANIRIGWKRLTVGKQSTYSDRELNIALKIVLSRRLVLSETKLHKHDLT